MKIIMCVTGDFDTEQLEMMYRRSIDVNWQLNQLSAHARQQFDVNSDSKRLRRCCLLSPRLKLPVDITINNFFFAQLSLMPNILIRAGLSLFSSKY